MRVFVLKSRQYHLQLRDKRCSLRFEPGNRKRSEHLSGIVPVVRQPAAVQALQPLDKAHDSCTDATSPRFGLELYGFKFTKQFPLGGVKE